MGRISAPQIIILLVFVVLIFGYAKLPDIASSIGKSLKVFKKEVTELRDGVDDLSTPEEQGPTSAAGGHTDTSSPTSAAGGHTDTSSHTSTTDANPDGPPRT